MIKRYSIQVLSGDVFHVPDVNGAWVCHDEIAAVLADFTGKRLDDLSILSDRLQGRWVSLEHFDLLLLKMAVPILVRIIREAGGG